MPRPKKAFTAFPFSYEEELELTITSLTNLGDGVGRMQISTPTGEKAEWVIFIPFALPGERVRAQVWRNDATYSHAKLIEVLEPSPDRVQPRCRLFQKCGGCQYQHLSYPAQLQAKRQQVGDLLERLAQLTPAVNPTLPSPEEWHYRSKITPHVLQPRRGKVKEIGFQRRGTNRSLVDVDYCPIALQEINQVLPALRNSIRKRGSSTETTLLLRADSERVTDNPRDVISETVGACTFHFLAGDFFQNNPAILPSFIQYVRQQALEGSQYLIDAYCGSGLFGLSLAPHFKQVAMVEVSETSADWARHNARLNKITNAHILTASAEHIFHAITFPAECTTILLDPPRKGCNTEFLKQLFAFQPSRVIYISCEPSTQARDLRHFTSAGYTITDVQPVDLFPQTRHLECIITLEATT